MTTSSKFPRPPNGKWLSVYWTRLFTCVSFANPPSKLECEFLLCALQSSNQCFRRLIRNCGARLPNACATIVSWAFTISTGVIAPRLRKRHRYHSSQRFERKWPQENPLSLQQLPGTIWLQLLQNLSGE